MSWGDTPGWELLTLKVATVYKDPPSTLPGHPVLKSLYSVMVLFLKFQMKGQRAKTMSSQPQPPYQLWPLPCALFPCLCSCGSLSSWRYLPVLVRGPLQTRTMAPKSRSQLEHTLTVTVVRCGCFSHVNTQACGHCIPRAKQWLYKQLTLPISEQTREMLIEIRLWDLIMTTPVDLSLFQTKKVILEKVCW